MILQQIPEKQVVFFWNNLNLDIFKYHIVYPVNAEDIIEIEDEKMVLVTEKFKYVKTKLHYTTHYTTK